MGGLVEGEGLGELRGEFSVPPCVWSPRLGGDVVLEGLCERSYLYTLFIRNLTQHHWSRSFLIFTHAKTKFP